MTLGCNMRVNQIIRSKIIRRLILAAVVFCSAVMVLLDYELLGKASTENPIHSHQKCLQQNIMYLKTHKTGSSTLTNILNRHADETNLSVVLPTLRNQYSFGWPRKFQLNQVGPLNEGPRILCNHARFNRVPLNVLFPKTSSRYLTIIREPVSHFDSVFYFFEFHQDTPFKTMNDFLSARLQYNEWYSMIEGNPLLLLSRNPLMFDLGFPVKSYENQTAIQNYIHFLDQEFDLVIILEHFDESLVLLKRLLCWNIEDILYFKLMERPDIERNKELITSKLRKKIKAWNQADVMLYNHFKATLWKKIKMEGEDFYKDLRHFRSELRRTKKTCLYKRRKKIKAYSCKYVMGYRMKNVTDSEIKQRCERMLIKEKSYVDYFRNQTSNINEDYIYL